MTDVRTLLADLHSPDPLVVCRGLKGLSGEQSLSRAELLRILESTRRGVISIERTALRTLVELGPRAKGIATEIVQRLAERTKDMGCSVSCCGFEAFHGPVELYCAALQAAWSTNDPDALRAFLASEPITPEVRDLLVGLFEL